MSFTNILPNQIYLHFCKTLDFRIKNLHGTREREVESRDLNSGARMKYLRPPAEAEAKFDPSGQLSLDL